MKLSVKQFAEQAGVTPQAVYKRLATLKNQFVTVENGQKYIDSEALRLFKAAGETTEQPTEQPEKQPTNQPNNQPVRQPLNGQGLELIEVLQNEIAFLRGQIEADRAQLMEKDKQLQAKDEQIAAKDGEIQALSEYWRIESERLHERQREAHLLIQNAQRLALPEGKPERRSWFGNIFRGRRDRTEQQEERTDG